MKRNELVSPIRTVISKREADPFARQAELRSVRLAPRLSRPSMGRDTLRIPSNSVASGRMGRGSALRLAAICARRFACGAGCQALRAWRPGGGRGRLRQAGQGLGSPAHVHLKPGLNGRASAGSVASTGSARSPSGRAWRGGWRTGGFRPQRSDSPAIRAPAHPAGRRICRWKRWRVSAHRGPRQPARRPNAANEILAGQPRGRDASAK